jgi:hypothetical protein
MSDTLNQVPAGIKWNTYIKVRTPLYDVVTMCVEREQVGWAQFRQQVCVVYNRVRLSM